MSSALLRILKLVTGDEIIGVIRDGANEVSEDENYTLDNLLFVTNPMKVVSEYIPESKVHALYLVDWIPAIKDTTVPIDKQRVITIGQPNKDLEAHYIDIILAEKMYHDLVNEQGATEEHTEAQDLADTLDEKLDEELEKKIQAQEVESVSDDSADASDENLSEEEKLAEKLKKHKFDDDDIQ
jgi:hypothetical protein